MAQPASASSLEPGGAQPVRQGASPAPCVLVSAAAAQTCWACSHSGRPGHEHLKLRVRSAREGCALTWGCSLYLLSLALPEGLLPGNLVRAGHGDELLTQQDAVPGLH